MVMLSELVGRPVTDGLGRGGHVADFAIDLSVPDYPPVRSVLVESREAPRMIPWSGIRREEGHFRVENLGAAQRVDDDRLQSTVFAGRDVMDALVLDVARRRAVRVNDVWLEEDADQLVVRGIDASPWAILRRLGRGWFGRGDGRNIVDARDVVYLRGNPDEARQQGDEHDALAQLRPAEVAGLAEALPYLHAAELMVLFPARRAASVFKRLSRERQIQVLGELDDETGVGILAEMSADQVADVLGRLRPAQAHHILELLPDEQAELIGELLRYPADTAGGIMTNEVVVVPGGITVAEAIETIREKLTRPNPVYVVYVVDDVRSCRLEGTLSFRDLLVAERERKVDDVMTQDLIVAGPLERATVAAYRLADYDFKALPVVGPDRQLLGVVTLDSAIAQIAPATIHRDLPKVFA